MKISEDSLIREICKESFAEFVKEFWGEICKNELVWNWHMQYLCDELQAAAEKVFKGEPCEKDIIINVSPGTSKSTICSQMFPAWVWTRMPEACIIGGSYSQQIAVNNSRKNRDIIKTEKYRRLFKIWIRKDQDAKSYFMNYEGGYRYAVGVGGSVTGMHGHFLMIDDPLNPKQAASPADLQTANDWMSETLPSRKIDKATALTVLIMQRLHEDDPTGHWLAQTAADPLARQIKHICLPATSDYDVRPPELRQQYIGGLFDPVRLNETVLRTMRVALGEYAYAGQFGQSPVPRVGGLFRPETLVMTSSLPGPIEKVIRYWDKAATRENGCYTAGVKIARLKDEAYIILDVVRGQWEPFQRNRIMQQTAELDGRLCTVAVEQEPGSGGKESALITAKEFAGYKVILDRPDADKTTRADPFASQVNAGNVYILSGDWNKAFIEEMRLFPKSKFKDQVDAAAAAFNLIALKKTINYQAMMSSVNKQGDKVPSHLASPNWNIDGIILPGLPRQLK